jgi:hypothetical protein
VVGLEGRSPHREARQRSLAPVRVPLVLALEVASASGTARITLEIRDLIRRLAEENVGWGAPKIHGELRKLGFEVSERTGARYLRRLRRRGDPKRNWLAFRRAVESRPMPPNQVIGMPRLGGLHHRYAWLRAG